MAAEPPDAPITDPDRPTITQPRADFRWLTRFILRHRKPAVRAVLAGIVAGIAASATPYYIGIIVDHVHAGVRLEQLLSDSVVFILLTLVSILCFFGQRFYSGEVAYRVNLDVRQAIYDNLLTLENSFYQQYSIGDLISRIHSDTEMVWRMLTLGFNRMGSAILTLVTTLVLLALINVPLAVVVFIVLTISTTVQMRAGRILAPLFERVQDQAGVLAAHVQDATSGIQTIKTFGRESGAAAAFRDKNVEYRRRWLYYKRRHEPIGMLPNAIADSTAAIVVLLGGILTASGQMTVGNFVQFLIFLAAISQALLQIGTVYQRYQQSRGALARITPIMRHARIADSADARPLTVVRGEITFDNVGVQIEGKWLLRSINLHIPAGKVAALVGATGAGKTLLVSLLARVLDPHEGRVLIDGLDVRDIKLEDLRRAIAYVPQATFLFSQPLQRNVQMGKDSVSDEELNRAVHISRLSNDLPQLPHGLDTLVGERGVMLSGGQKQRVAIARAIVRDPAILVLDDALSSVDTQTAADILHDLRDVLRTRTSLIIAHRIATVKDADLVVVLHDGHIVEQGTHDQLVARGGRYARMVERELREEDRRIFEEDEALPTAGD